MRDMLIAVPSRGRPGSVDRLIQAMHSTCVLDTQLAVGLDADDEHNYPRRDGVEYDVRDDLRYVTSWNNALIAPRLKDYKYIGAGIGDDNLPRTRGWDYQVATALERQSFAFTNDLYPREPGSLSCHMFMRREVVEKLGYAGPPSIAHMYVDVAWYAWGVACGMTYLGDVIIEHLHYTTSKSSGDATYDASQALIPSDMQNWHSYSQGGQLNEDIEKLGGHPFTPEGLREFNRKLFIPC
jgi:hypothetical protein